MGFMSDEMMNSKVCSVCGNILKERHIFCKKCGTKYEAVEPEIEQPIVEELVEEQPIVEEPVYEQSPVEEVVNVEPEVVTPVQEEITFCTGCGNKLSPGVAFCSVCGKPVKRNESPAPIRFCVNCGSLLKDGVAFCSNCGHKCK